MIRIYVQHEDTVAPDDVNMNNNILDIVRPISDIKLFIPMSWIYFINISYDIRRDVS